MKLQKVIYIYLFKEVKLISIK